LGFFATVLTLQAVVLPFIALVVLFWPPDSVVTYNGVVSPMGEVRWKLLGMLVAWFAFAAYFGPSLWRGSPIARRAFIVACLVAAAAGPIGTFVAYQGEPGLVVAIAQVILSNLVGCGIFWWYLYVKPNVRQFFERRPAGIAGAA
jgi:hypothetical protein